MIDLSEAIKIGSLVHKQGFGAYKISRSIDANKDGVPNRIVTHTCALGSALVGIGITDFDALNPEFPEEWDLERGVYYNKCNCLHKKDTLKDLILHLNDYHRWSREEIAEEIESL